MELVAWIKAFAVLALGCAGLHSCRAILRFTTRGVALSAADGLMQMASSGRLSSRESGLLAALALQEYGRTRAASTPPARSPGSRTALRASCTEV